MLHIDDQNIQPVQKNTWNSYSVKLPLFLKMSRKEQVLLKLMGFQW